MSTVAKDFGMGQALKQLGLEAVNQGTSTGNSWYPGERKSLPILR